MFPFVIHHQVFNVLQNRFRSKSNFIMAAAGYDDDEFDAFDEVDYEDTDQYYDGDDIVVIQDIGLGLGHSATAGGLSQDEYMRLQAAADAEGLDLDIAGAPDVEFAEAMLAAARADHAALPTGDATMASAADGEAAEQPTVLVSQLTSLDLDEAARGVLSNNPSQKVGGALFELDWLLQEAGKHATQNTRLRWGVDDELELVIAPPPASADAGSTTAAAAGTAGAGAGAGTASDEGDAALRTRFAKLSIDPAVEAPVLRFLYRTDRAWTFNGYTGLEPVRVSGLCSAANLPQAHTCGIYSSPSRPCCCC